MRASRPPLGSELPSGRARLPHQDGSRILRLRSCLRSGRLALHLPPVRGEQACCNSLTVHVYTSTTFCDEESIFRRYSKHGRNWNIPFAFVSRHRGEHLGAHLRRRAEEEEVAFTSCNMCSNTHLQCVMRLCSHDAAAAAANLLIHFILNKGRRERKGERANTDD